MKKLCKVTNDVSRPPLGRYAATHTASHHKVDYPVHGWYCGILWNLFAFARICTFQYPEVLHVPDTGSSAFNVGVTLNAHIFGGAFGIDTAIDLLCHHPLGTACMNICSKPP